MRAIRLRRRPSSTGATSAAHEASAARTATPVTASTRGPAGSDGPLTWERLTLRADLAYALAAAEGRDRLGPDDLPRADALARQVLARRARRRSLIA